MGRPIGDQTRREYRSQEDPFFETCPISKPIFTVKMQCPSTTGCSSENTVNKFKAEVRVPWSSPCWRNHLNVSLLTQCHSLVVFSMRFLLRKNKFPVIPLFIAYFLIGEKNVFPRHSAIRSIHPVCSYPFSTDLCHIQQNGLGEQAVETVLLQWSSWRCFYRAGTFFSHSSTLWFKKEIVEKCHGKGFGLHCNPASRSRINKGKHVPQSTRI